MTTKKTIYLIRHGQTDYNLKGIIQGRGIDSNLNEKGLAQADAFFDHYRHIEFDKVYTSNLKRTQQSVASFSELNIATKSLEGLDEINWGVHEGQVATKEHKKIFNYITRKWQNGFLDYAPDGGESPLQLQIRQKIALDHILSREEEEKVLVCSHGRAMRSLLCLMLNKSLERMDEFAHTNLCLYKLAVKRSGFIEVLEANNTIHLNSEIRSNFP